ncbi:hypothetical protein ACH5Y9_04705 [Methylomonas sp. BW4-1]|uniref:hypothetical protein n=1 Tax=Methylomonas sp. BW4-1 TaxID=3376685 RepID=UPI004042610C
MNTPSARVIASSISACRPVPVITPTHRNRWSNCWSSFAIADAKFGCITAIPKPASPGSMNTMSSAGSSRSTGTIKVPLLIEPGEIGGPALLDHCIVRIDSPRQVLYQHADFRVGEVELVRGELKHLPWEIWIDGSVHARFNVKTEARQYQDFIQGQRFALI